VSLAVVFRETALRNLARIRSDDKDLFARTRRTVALLADEPYPPGAVAWGATGIYRLHAGHISILYEVDLESATVYIIKIGPSPESPVHQGLTADFRAARSAEKSKGGTPALDAGTHRSSCCNSQTST
jgi:mRNA-degrading endonuclease RelE of RelBE toxin-antitoxin system